MYHKEQNINIVFRKSVCSEWKSNVYRTLKIVKIVGLYFGISEVRKLILYGKVTFNVFENEFLLG